MGRSLGGRDLGLCGGAQGHNERMVAGATHDGSRGEKRPPTLPLCSQPSLRPKTAATALCACSCDSGSASLRHRVASPGTAHPGGVHSTSAAPARPRGCCSPDGTHRPGLVRKKRLFPEVSELRTRSRPRVVWFSRRARLEVTEATVPGAAQRVGLPSAPH